MNSAQSNIKLKGQMNSKFDELSTENRLNKESNETKIKWFGIIIKEIFYFQNLQNFGLKLGEIEEH